ncbi:MAG: Autoinducer 1 sensor kinase/phosphatase LuxN [Candidatus Anoxychlamydiales bacterium]|nr:Autoinducer 1 sensor kinase/phosphatase LuxN [Candidatus Anoxychlamydiales bacterium]
MVTTIKTPLDHASPYCLHSYNQHFFDPTIIFDVYGMIQYYNLEIVNFLNCSEGILKGKNIKAVVPDFDLQNLKLFFQTSTENLHSSIQQTSSDQPIRIMVHTFKYLDEMYFCAQIKPVSPSVLLVDDDLMTREIVKRLFEQNGCKCDVAINGEEALAILTSKERKSSIDMVFTDYMMPKMNGLDESKEIRKKNKRVPIILNTANEITHDFKKKCKRKDRIQKVLQKPFSIKKLSPVFEKFNFPHI